jgi:ketosteroid isomerase-like protein
VKSVSRSKGRENELTHHEHPNVALVRQGFDAFDSGDIQALDGLLADDIVWHVGGKSQLSGTYRGKQEVLELFAKQSQLLGDQRAEVHDIVGNDNHVIAIGKASMDDPDGRTVEWNFANVFHVKGGKATEVWGLADETSESDAVIDKLMSK